MFQPNTTDLRHLSLTANNISAKLTNQCTQTGLSTFNWQLPFTWLWWLLLRLSKRQSPLPTTVLLRTTITWTIKLHYCMLPPGSNHLLNNISIDLSIFNLFSYTLPFDFIPCFDWIVLLPIYKAKKKKQQWKLLFCFHTLTNEQRFRSS